MWARASRKTRHQLDCFCKAIIDRMMEGSLRNAIWLSLLWAMTAVAADVTGLALQSEAKITAQTAGAPFEGEPAASIWAISFSPNGQYLAFGVQFVRANDFNFPSYLLVVSPARPDVVLKKFEMPRHPAMRNVSRLVWSADSRYLGVTPYGNDWYQVAVVDLDANQVRVVSNRNGSGWCDGVGGLLPGPQVLEYCAGSNQTTVRFFRLDGAAAQEEWILLKPAAFLGVTPDGGMLALDFPIGQISKPVRHEIVIFNLNDRSEARRWSLDDAQVYNGTFAQSGRAFCTVADPTWSRWNIESRAAVSRPAKKLLRAPLSADRCLSSEPPATSSSHSTPRP